MAVAAPGAGPGYWAGAPSAALVHGGSYLLAYRLKHGFDGRVETVVARSDDGERFTTVATLEAERFDAFSVERPALVPGDGGSWLLYVSCATPGTKHWWIGLLEAAEPAGFADSAVRRVLPGDEHTGVKDPVVRRVEGGLEAWICCHPLDERDEEDRMTTAYATSRDGVDWRWHGTALAGRPGMWDARGARVTAVLADGRASYDGRATKEENWFEKTGRARRAGADGRLEPEGDAPVSDARYLEVLALPDSGYRIYYEAPLPDGSHELRTELIS